MIEKKHTTPCGTIHYWVNDTIDRSKPALIFLPGLTTDHRLFEKQILHFKDKYPILVWDAPAHASSWPFELTFSMQDKALWLDEILTLENVNNPVIIGQSMGGYVGQMYSELFPDKLKGFISIDSAPLQRSYTTAIETSLLKTMGLVLRYSPWQYLLESGSDSVAESQYGRRLMKEMMMVYNNDQNRYADIAEHGYQMIADAIENDLAYQFNCPVLLICGKKDKAGLTVQYNKAWHKQTGFPIEWIEDAGHNSNTDKPDLVNDLIENFVESQLS